MNVTCQNVPNLERPYKRCKVQGDKSKVVVRVSVRYDESNDVLWTCPECGFENEYSYHTGKPLFDGIFG